MLCSCLDYLDHLDHLDKYHLRIVLRILRLLRSLRSLRLLIWHALLYQPWLTMMTQTLLMTMILQFRTIQSSMDSISTFHPYWADWHLCQWARLEPFRTPCARRPPALKEQPAIPSSMGLTEIDGGMSTLWPWSGQPVKQTNGILASLYSLMT